MPNKTPWFDGSVKPVRPGVYEVSWNGMAFAPRFSHWNGRRWGFRDFSAKEAHETRASKAMGPIHEWRGLTKEAK